MDKAPVLTPSHLGSCAKLLSQMLGTEEKMMALRMGLRSNTAKKPATSQNAKKVTKTKSGRVAASKKPQTGMPTRGGKFTVRGGRQAVKHIDYKTLLQSDAEDSLKSKTHDSPGPLNNSDAVTKAEAYAKYYAMEKERLQPPKNVAYTGAPNVPTKDKGVVPFNKRLQSSTPNVTPTKSLKHKKDVLQQLLKDVLQEPEPDQTAVKQSSHERAPVSFPASSMQHTAQEGTATRLNKYVYSEEDLKMILTHYKEGNITSDQLAHFLNNRNQERASVPGTTGNQAPGYFNAGSFTGTRRDAAPTQNSAMFSNSAPFPSNPPVHTMPVSGTIPTGGQMFYPMNTQTTTFSSSLRTNTAPVPVMPSMSQSLLVGNSLPPNWTGHTQPAYGSQAFQHTGPPVTATSAQGVPPPQAVPPTQTYMSTQSTVPATQATNKWPSTYEEYLAMRDELNMDPLTAHISGQNFPPASAALSHQNRYDLQEVPTKEHDIHPTTNIGNDEQNMLTKEMGTCTRGDIVTPTPGSRSRPVDVPTVTDVPCSGTPTDTSPPKTPLTSTEFSSSPVISPTQDVENEPPLPKSSGKKKGKVTKKSKASALAISHLLKEMKAMPLAGKDREFMRVLNELETAFSGLLPAGRKFDFQTELDMALQPLRSENASLRRRLRILTHQHKEKEAAQQSSENETFELLHLKMTNKTLEAQLNEEKAAKETLQEQLKLSQYETEKLSLEKQDMVQLITNKDADHLKSQQDWLDELRKLRSTASRYEAECVSLRKELSNHEEAQQATKNALKQKTADSDRLSSLVRSLQFSMKDLLNNLGGSSSTVSHQMGSAVDHLQHAIKLLEGESDSPAAAALSSTDPDPIAHTSSPRRPLTAISEVNTEASSPIAAVTQPTPAPHSTRPFQSLPLFHSSQDDTDTYVSSGEHTEQPTRLSVQFARSLDSQSKPSRLSTEGSMDSTQYLFPAGTSTSMPKRPSGVSPLSNYPGSSRVGTLQANDTAGLTVKDILGGLAEKLRQQNIRDPANQVQVAHDETSSGHQNQSHHVQPAPPTDMAFLGEDLLIDENLSEEGDSTLDEAENFPSEKLANQSRYSCVTNDANQSRYSVTDYFKKYSSSNNVAGMSGGVSKKQKWLPEPDTRETFLPPEQPKWNTEFTTRAKAPSSDKLSEIQSWAAGVEDITVVNSSAASSSHQGELYRGTELDTSLSTIQDSATIVSSTNASTISSFDDHAFEQGLANLDENIARIQASLKASKIGQ